MREQLRIRAFVHTCAPRQGKLGPTLASLDASDLAGNYEVIEAPVGIGTDAFERWYLSTMRRMATEPLDDGLPADLIVRVEDDTIVNKHIAHNCCTWPAVREPDFGIGWLFLYDPWWNPDPRTMMRRGGDDERIISKDVDIPGGQGQVFRSEVVESILACIPDARIHRKIGSTQCMPGPREDLWPDTTLSHATQLASLFVYLHKPALVNCHSGSTDSIVSNGIIAGHFSHKNFSADWRRS
jgi:hypothetical protein